VAGAGGAGRGALWAWLWPALVSPVLRVLLIGDGLG
jgi:hypothetical protein